MPGNRPGVAFRPVAVSDYPTLSAWMARPHWRQWWGDPETEFGYIRDMVEGNDTTRPFIFLIDGKAAGYIQYWFIGDHQNETWLKDDPWLAHLPGDAVGVDISIGDEKNLSKGIGTAVLSQFVEELVGKGFRTIIIDPDIENRRAVRAYEKAGFRPVPELQGKTGGVLIMQYRPNAKETQV